jgi:hypothetical protein
MPEHINGQSPDAIPEGQGLLPGVEHVPGHQPTAKPLGKVAQSGKIFATNGGAGFYFNGDDAAIRCLQDRIDLDPVFGSVMMKASTLGAPCEPVTLDPWSSGRKVSGHLDAIRMVIWPTDPDGGRAAMAQAARAAYGRP